MRDDRPNNAIQRAFADAEHVTIWSLTFHEWLGCAAIAWVIVRAVRYLVPYLGSIPIEMILASIFTISASALLSWVGTYYFVKVANWASGRFEYPINSFGEFAAVIREEDVDYPPPCTNCDCGDRDGVLTKTYLKTVRFGFTIAAEQQTELYECRECIEADPIERQFLAAGLDLPNYDDDEETMADPESGPSRRVESWPNVIEEHIEALERSRARYGSDGELRSEHEVTGECPCSHCQQVRRKRQE